jgi:hypothetical protein
MVPDASVCCTCVPGGFAPITPVCRYRTDLTAQFNTRIMPAAFDRFYQIADEQGWKIGETVERALAARERELGQGR